MSAQTMTIIVVSACSSSSLSWRGTGDVIATMALTIVPGRKIDCLRAGKHDEKDSGIHRA
jgi:hypothetical protein